MGLVLANEVLTAVISLQALTSLAQLIVASGILVIAMRTFYAEWALT